MQTNVVYLFVRQKDDAEKFPSSDILLKQAWKAFWQEAEKEAANDAGTGLWTEAIKAAGCCQKETEVPFVPEIARTEKGKPYFSAGSDCSKEPMPFCSVSHTGNLWMATISAHRVGLDAEERKSVDAVRIAKRYFSQEEQGYLLSVAEAERERAFFRIWCRKEAAVKFAGSSLGYGISRYIVAQENGLSEGIALKIAEDMPNDLPDEKKEVTAFFRDAEEVLKLFGLEETTVVLATTERSAEICVRKLK